MLKRAALIVGIVFLIIGVAGFIPGITVDSDGMKKLFGLFMVDSSHNVVHLVTGAVCIAAAYRIHYARIAFQVMGIAYALFTIIGFIIGSGNTVLGLFPVNTADNFLHLALTAVFIYFGFAARERQAAAVEASVL